MAIRVFFATNRNHQPNNKTLVFGPRFNADGVAALRFGHATFDGEPEEPRLQSVYVYPDSKRKELQKTRGSGKFLDDLRQVMAGERSDTLVFVHGYNVTFNEALVSGARLARSLKVEGRPVNVVIFSWPSDGAAVPLMSYYSDREDARASGPAIARAFLKLKEYLEELDRADYCQRCLHLITHSMGAYVLRNALQAALAKDPKSLTRVFDQIMLAAPDEDDDTFETEDKLKLLPRIGRQVTVYFNPRDLALIVSDKTKANPDRLGSDGPRLVDLLPKKVVLVDCRQVACEEDQIRHGYFCRSRAMLADIAEVLHARSPEAIGNRTYIAEARAWRISAELAAS